MPTEPSNQKSELDPLETSIHQPPPLSFQEFKLRGKEAEYKAALQAYAMWGGDEDTRRHGRLQECSTKAYFMRNTVSGDVAVMGSRCRLRWCPICASGKRHIIEGNVEPWIEDQEFPKFMTLTVRHNNKPLRQQVEDLYDAFKKLRRHKYFKSKCTGGIWFFEVKMSKATGQWHPHIHCCIAGLFLKKSELKKCWLQATQGSYIVHIVKISDVKKAAAYVAKYAAKPCKLSGLPCYRRVELIEAMHGQRIVGTWGVGRDIRLTMPKVGDFKDWRAVGAWSTVIGTMDCDDNAHKIYFKWKTGKPLDANLNMDHVEKDWYDAYLADVRRKKIRVDQMTGWLFNWKEC